MYVYGPHFILRCECMYMDLTLPLDVYVLYGSHFTLKCVCMYMVLTLS